MIKSLKVTIVMLLCALGACSGETHALPTASFNDSAVTSMSCQARSNDTPARLEACIQGSSLWTLLATFQTIAEQNPGPQGHPTRDTGTPGYRASVAFVAQLMRQAGYSVKIQPYHYSVKFLAGAPQFRTPGRSYAYERDWVAALGSGGGTVAAPAERVERGCSAAGFSNFTRGDIALMLRDSCTFDAQVANAEAAGASAVILYAQDGSLDRVRLVEPANVPVIGLRGLLQDIRFAHLELPMFKKSGTDYNVIADSPLGDPNHVVVLEGHLDSIFGEGMLDNASGSTTMLETALQLAKTTTLNRLRYIWFGGEEIGLLGSQYYTKHLTNAEFKRIDFDIDADVTATPNFDIQIASASTAGNVKKFPPNVVPQSRVGDRDFIDYFKSVGVVGLRAPFGSSGTDSNSFGLRGIPNTGILTEQDCCKKLGETKVWGGFLGDYEGVVPGVHQGCVDTPDRWCDNLSNNSPFVLELVSKAVAVVTLELANDRSIR